MRTWVVMDALRRFGIFICQYGFIKCIKTVICGLAVMLPLLLLHECRRRRGSGWPELSFYSWLLLLPMALTGMSRLFFQRHTFRLTNVISELGASWVSGAYFAVMLTLAGWWLLGKHMLCRQVRRMYCWRSPQEKYGEAEENWSCCVQRVTGGDCRRLTKWYLNRIRVYISEEHASPFCGGVLCPYIVMPDIFLELPGAEGGFPGEGTSCHGRRGLTRQGRVLLCHELLHLRSGHILWLNLFAMLRIYWWINPLIYLCENLLQQDMERACDEGCLYYTGVSEREYGRLLLTVAAGQTQASPVGAASFLKNRDYASLKLRIGSLRGERERYRAVHRALSRGCAVMLAAGVLAVGITSYPRYTQMHDMCLFDENLNLVCRDSPQLRAAVQVVDGYLQIDPGQMDACLEELGIEGDYVYLCYDTIMKVPGVGGGGNTGRIALADYEDIFYLRAQVWENDFMEFCLKYLL